MPVGYPKTATSSEFLLRVSQGLVPGHSLQYVHAYATAIGTTEILVWPKNVPYTFNDSTTTTLYLTSSDAADVGKVVRVYWLDGEHKPQRTDVLLNGVTPVVIGVGMRVNRMFTLGAATLGDVYVSNALTHTAGVPTDATIVSYFTAKTQTRSMLLFTVPAGHTAYGIDGYFSSAKGKDTDFFWNVRNPQGSLPEINTNVVSVYETTVVIPFDWTSIPEKTDAFFTAAASASSGRVSSRIPILVVDNDYIK